MLNELDKVIFWDKKILTWENARYKNSKGSIYRRQSYCLNLIKKIPKNTSILELGCGSGLLANEIYKLGFLNYTGIDFSNTAINNANKRKKSWPKSFRFYCEDPTSTNINYQADLVISLGFLDWLTDKQIYSLSQRLDVNHSIHSFSNNGFNLLRFAHLIFVFFQYGKDNKGYTPIYRSKSDIARILELDNYNILKDKYFSFSRIAYTL